MKRITLFLISFILVTAAQGQQKHSKSEEKTSKVIVSLSYYWKLDSVAGNGFRLYAVDRLLTSKLDTVSKSFLFSYLGKPNAIWNTNHGQEILYYYFDYRAMPKGFDAPLACWYITFLFPEGAKWAKELDKGDIDL